MLESESILINFCQWEQSKMEASSTLLIAKCCCLEHRSEWLSGPRKLQLSDQVVISIC